MHLPDSGTPDVAHRDRTPFYALVADTARIADCPYRR